MKDVNSVTLVGRLTRDPELRATQSGTSVCTLRVAFSTSRKNASGAWEDKPNYVDVTVWGSQGETCAQHLSKGRQVAILGRLEWREWEDSNSGAKRQAIDITAEQVQFLGSRDSDGSGDGGSRFTPQSDIPASQDPAADFAPEPSPAGGADDDIPF